MKTLIWKLSLSASMSAVIFISSFTHALAEDIEIYNRTQTVPNVLFVIDTSGSMNEPATVSANNPTRLDVVKTAFSSMLGQTYPLLNVGFMDFRHWSGAGVDMPVADVTQLAQSVEPLVGSSTETYAELLTRSVNALNASGQTPTVEALYEAALYFRGEEPYEGDSNAPHTGWGDAANVSRYTGGHWKSAGLRTYAGGNLVNVNAGWCLNEAVKFSGSNYNICGSQPINASTCENYNDQRCDSASYTCSGGQTSEGACPGGWQCTGNLINEVHERCRLSDNRLVGSSYVSPIQTACTANYIVMLSDGEPTEDDSTAKSNIESLIGKSNCDSLAAKGIVNSGIIDKGECGTDLVEFLNTVDQSDTQSGDQFITTHTIGFQLAAASEGRKYLEELASAGGGSYFNASDPSSLVTTLQNIVSSIVSKSRTIARVGNTIDLSTLGSSRDEVYVPMFTAEPNQPRWPGNMKGYTLDPNGVLVGLDNNPVFTADGDFSASSRSYWSSSADGSDVTMGGVASLLNPATRNVQTDDGAGSLISLDAANTALTGNPALFGLPAGSTSTAAVQDLINWARGVDLDDEDGDGSTTDARNFVGDALHTDPIVANYTGQIERVVYFMTNEGYLHAINVTGNTSTSGGNELFSFMPSDLLTNLPPLRQNVGGSPKIYGLDGPLTLFQVGGATNTTGSKYLFFGMRRGGMNYYAMDVTDPTSPSLMWSIKGGAGNFQELAQSWSEPIVTNVTHNGSTKLALVFGGGYDTTQDTAATYTADTQGRAIYIVDAVTGAKLWSAGPSSSAETHDLDLSLTNGIAGDVSTIDFDNDSITDRLYFGDTGGNIWRIDLQGDLNGSAGFNADFSGYKLADLGGTNASDNRRFFARPIAALTAQGKLAVAVGSGHRSQPLNTAVQDRFYVLYDPNTNGVPTSAPTAITDSDLQDITGFTNGFDNTGSLVSGWRFDLDIAGEKVFNTASVLRGEVFLSTYYPPTTPCSNDPDGSRLFVLDLEGNPTRDLDSTITGMEPYVNTLNFGIVSEFTLHYSGYDGNVRGINLPNVQGIYQTGSLFDRFWINKPNP
jgi:type IV pilus assembly protein PilY1